MKGPLRIETARLILRKPHRTDAETIFQRYSSDPEVTRLVGWPTHRSVEDARVFVTFSDSEWTRWPAGPYLIESRETGQLLGGTGLGFKSSELVETGYVLAKDAWGFGYATEALGAMVEVARSLGVRWLCAFCHPEHAASVRVLEKCGFKRERLLKGHAVFPNLDPAQPADCLRYGRDLGPAPSTSV